VTLIDARARQRGASRPASGNESVKIDPAQQRGRLNRRGRARRRAAHSSVASAARTSWFIGSPREADASYTLWPRASCETNGAGLPVDGRWTRHAPPERAATMVAWCRPDDRSDVQPRRSCGAQNSGSRPVWCSAAWIARSRSTARGNSRLAIDTKIDSSTDRKTSPFRGSTFVWSHSHGLRDENL